MVKGKVNLRLIRKGKGKIISLWVWRGLLEEIYSLL